MAVPPQEVPDGLSSEEYKRLATLYTLMGCQRQAVEAMNRSCRMDGAGTGDASGSSQTNEGEQTNGVREGMRFGLSLLKLLRKTTREMEELEEQEDSFIAPDDRSSSSSIDLPNPTDGSNRPDLKNPTDRSRKSEETETNSKAGKSDRLRRSGNEPKKNDPRLKRKVSSLDDALKGYNDALKRDATASDGADDGDPLAEMREQLLELGVSVEEVDKYLDSLVESLNEIKHSKPPPREVPEDLSAEEYYELGLKYKEVGWTEQARDALAFAIEADPDGDAGNKARRFLRTKIPRFPVPLVAEQANIKGFNQLFNGEQESARETFESLIAEYPDFEWPYGNLGSLLIQQGEVEHATQILRRALEINPEYVNAWLHLARAEALQGDFVSAYSCLDRVTKIDPDDQNMKGIRQLVDQVSTN